MISRRNFLRRAAAVIAAPAIVQVANIMPVVARPPQYFVKPRIDVPGCTMWDFSPGTVFQDREGLIPAGPGDPVALVKPVYDNGGFGVMMAQADDERPIVVQEANGRWALEVDGVNDRVATGFDAPIQASLGGPNFYNQPIIMREFQVGPQLICFDAD